ncbi:MAG: hypothetical protein U1E87_02455 [Alphaproteobacteria bacterium]
MRLRAYLKVRRAGFVLAAMLLALGALTAAQAAVVSLAGGYNGTGKAAAMAMILDQDEDRIYGRIVDGRNNVFQIGGRVNGRTVQGTLYNAAISANFQIELKPSGLKFVIIPLVDGKPNLGAMKQISFERGRVTHPALADYRAPAPRQGEMIGLLAFLDNYPSWDKAQVVVAFKGLPEKDRALLRTYDHLQADLMNRLCRGGADTGDILSISKGGSLDCVRLVALVDRADEAGALRAFYDRAELQRAALYTRIACERSVYAASRCAQEAVGAPPPWRDAAHIFGDLKDARAQASKVGPVPSLLAPRLAMPKLQPVSASPSPPRTLPMPAPQGAADQSAPLGRAGAPAALAPSAQPRRSGFVAFFQSKPAGAGQSAGAAPSETDDLLASLDLKLKPSTAKEQAKLMMPKVSAEEGFLARVRAKMRARPLPAKSTDAKAEGEGITGSVVKVPTPRPRPATRQHLG